MAHAVSAKVLRIRASWCYLLFGVVTAVLFGVAGQPLVSAALFCLAGLGTGAAILYGVRRFGPDPAWPWRCLAAAAAAFVVGAIMRGVLPSQGESLPFLADVFTLPGYALMFLGLMGFLRTRTGALKHAVIDGLLVGIGTALIFIIFFAEPAASIAGRPVALSLLAGFYPLLDCILVLLVVGLAFSTARRGPAYYLLIGCMVLMLIGDIGYAVIGTEGELSGSVLLDLPFLLGFVLIGTAALHPSMIDIGRRNGVPAQAWSVGRLLLIAPALAVPFALDIAIKEPTVLDRTLLTATELIAVSLLAIRAVSAVQGLAGAQREYEYQATHDALTGLANRSLWIAGVHRMLGDATVARPVWVYFIDLDGFKLVNDSRGHTAGDQVISQVAERLRRCIPPGATIGRVGGDEFVVAYQANRDDAVALADTLLATLRHTLTMPAANVVISASIGIAHTAGTMTAEDLLRDADIAMYQAKESGRDAWKIVDPEMRDKIKRRIETDVALREALGTGQLTLAYQPIVRIATGEITGAEALIRWNHPTEGSVPPSKFISVAEESGLIVDIGRWVIREAVTQLATWRAQGHVGDDFLLAFNVSPRQLRDPQLAAELEAILVASDVPGGRVAVELTESVMIDTANGAEQAMSQLRSLGVRLVVDDFGTGFSALGYLRKYPLTGVKIDKSFVSGLGSQSEDQAIVHAVVAMSDALRLGVVAEGIEKPEQRDMLLSLGVIYGQGWLWGAAVDAKTFTDQWSRIPSASVV